MSPRELQRIVRDMAGKGDEAVDRELRAAGVTDPTDRVAVKHALAAMAQQRTIAARLATDDTEWHPADRPMQPLTEIERLMQRIGIELGSATQYEEREIDRMLLTAGITDPMQRIWLKHEAEARGLLRPPRPPEDGRRPSGSMRASAERPKGKPLLNADGSLRTLRFS